MVILVIGMIYGHLRVNPGHLLLAGLLPCPVIFKHLSHKILTRNVPKRNLDGKEKNPFPENVTKICYKVKIA